jgi:hypothetical protein
MQCPRDGFTVAHCLPVADIDRSASLEDCCTAWSGYDLNQPT